MKIDVTQPIVDLSGRPVPEGAEEGSPVLTLRSAIVTALLTPFKGDETMEGPAKLKHFLLAQRVHGDDAPDLKAEDIALIKARIGKGYAALVVGRAFELLDPE